MRLVILESPYAGNIEANLKYARRAMWNAIHLHNESPIASHLIYTQPEILDDNNPAERDLGIRCGLAWSRVADAHVFYTDLGWSRGMIGALEFCQREKRPYELRAMQGIVKSPDEYYQPHTSSPLQFKEPC